MPKDGPAWKNKSPGKENCPPEALPLEALFQKYEIDRNHAYNVARNALELFDLLAPFHGLDMKSRRLMEVAALVHDVGVSTSFEKHHTAGRDILFRHPPAELPEQLRPVIAWTAFLHRKRAGEKKLEKLRKTSFAKMPGEARDITLKLAALLRLADALDYSRMESRLGALRFVKRKAVFQVNGPGASVDAERMAKKADLWHLLFDAKLEFEPRN